MSGDGKPPVTTALAPAVEAMAIELSSEAVVVISLGGLITHMNRIAERLSGWRRVDAIGQRHDRLFSFMDASNQPLPSPVELALTRQQAKLPDEEDCFLVSPDGRRIVVRPACAPLRRAGKLVGALLMIQERTEYALLAAELEYRASNDLLTGLLNREAFEAGVVAAVRTATNGGTRAWVAYLDLDQFKVVNSTLGYVAGNELLRSMAGVLRSRLGPDDLLARLGGDEFGVLIAGGDERRAQRIVQDLGDAARRFRFFWGDDSYAITTSIGVTVINSDTHSAAQVLSQADAACFAAKDEGRDRARWSGPDDAELSRRRGEMSLIGKIGRALDEDRFELYYEDVVTTQPPHTLRYREILMRVRAPDGRIQSPGSFIGAAERYHLMTAIDRRVIAQAVEMISKLPDEPVIYALNVSGMSLSDGNFLAYVAETLLKSGARPERICFEITETAAIAHLSQAVRFISRLADLGCCFALDDFGAGMATFSYLKNLPVDFLKIDGSFVRSMMDSRVDHGMVEAINRIGHDLGLRTIAEHVESLALIEPLTDIGVDWVQGHAIGWAKPLSDLIPKFD